MTNAICGIVLENFSCSQIFTGMTARWMLNVEQGNNSFGAPLLGRIGARVANLCILPVALVDSIIQLAIGLFKIIIGIPICAIHKVLAGWRWKNENVNELFNLSSIPLHLKSVKHHFVGGTWYGFGLGVYDPMAAAQYFHKKKPFIFIIDEENSLIEKKMCITEKNTIHINRKQYDILAGEKIFKAMLDPQTQHTSERVTMQDLIDTMNVWLM